jgi:hypothetical protein
VYVDLRFGRVFTANQALVMRLINLDYLDAIVPGKIMKQDNIIHHEHCPDGSYETFKSS